MVDLEGVSQVASGHDILDAVESLADYLVVKRPQRIVEELHVSEGSKVATFAHLIGKARYNHVDGLLDFLLHNVVKSLLVGNIARVLVGEISRYLLRDIDVLACLGECVIIALFITQDTVVIGKVALVVTVRVNDDIATTRGDDDADRRRTSGLGAGRDWHDWNVAVGY